jgi:hypothetical protein
MHKELTELPCFRNKDGYITRGELKLAYRDRPMQDIVQVGIIKANLGHFPSRKIKKNTGHCTISLSTPMQDIVQVGN